MCLIKIAGSDYPHFRFLCIKYKKSASFHNEAALIGKKYHIVAKVLQKAVLKNFLIDFLLFCMKMGWDSPFSLREIKC